MSKIILYIFSYVITIQIYHWKTEKAPCIPWKLPRRTWAKKQHCTILNNAKILLYMFLIFAIKETWSNDGVLCFILILKFNTLICRNCRRNSLLWIWAKTNNGVSKIGWTDSWHIWRKIKITAEMMGWYANAQWI